MWYTILEALEETIILLPFLFVCYVLIELIENWTSKKSARSLKNNGFQVLLGASLGLIPQCGFGVVATDLYAKKRIRMGALIAIYIATSDEAVPVILSHPDKIGTLIPLILCKFIFALLAGYVVMTIEIALEKKQLRVMNKKSISENSSLAVKISGDGNTDAEKHHEDENGHFSLGHDSLSDGEHAHEEHRDEHEGHVHSHDHGEQQSADDEVYDAIHIGCCGHEIEESEDEVLGNRAKIKHYLWHPFLHTMYIFAFILVVNIVFSLIIYFVGEEAMASFMSQAKLLTPLLSVIIGLIPNCAASVVLTNMYLIGSLPFGAMVAGLIANAGIAVTVLFKQNKNLKQNLIIVGVCVLTALVAGYSLLLIL